jgi:diadenosine tetraphosphate (Ap4A) HIT family hydrolase
MSCPFCNIDGLRNRIFYENDKWFAFLAAPNNTKGHAIIAERPCGSVCPRVDRRGWGDLHCFGATLGQVATTLMKHYGPRDILFSSLRGDIAHFHVHLIPLWANEEDSWRMCKGDGYKRGHLMEFLGNLEKQADEKVERELKIRQITIDELRREITELLKDEVEELRKLTEYSSPQQTNPADT